MSKLAALVLSLSVFLTGCQALHQRYDLEVPEIKTATVKNLTVGVQDARDYVVSKEKPEQYIGFHISAFGTHLPVYAANEQPLADVFADRIQKGLAETGVKVKLVNIPVQMKKEDAIRKLASTQQKSVLITLYDWKTITVLSSKHFYDVEIAVYDASGRLLAAKKLKGLDVLKRDGTISHSWRLTSAEMMEKLESLFSMPQIAEQL